MKYLNALNTIPGVGNGTLRQLLGALRSGEAIWQAPASALAGAGISEALAQKIVAARLQTDPESEWAKLEKEGISALLFTDERYSALLKEMPSPPCLLYIKGNVECLTLPSIAIVGSRKFTDYGKMSAQRFSRDLSKAGLCIISGLALGIDAIAHQACLDANGKTIAVLGNSLDDASINPRTNYNLSREILNKGGLLVSEFPVPTAPTVGTFPARNRIMAGLSLGTLVIEAAEKSGSLITANFAAEFNREVFSVPGSIFSAQSEGTNSLIKKGAKLTASVSDILEELRIKPAAEKEESKVEVELSEDEKTIVHVLSPEPTHIDRIARLTKLETSTISANLAMLEIKGAIRNIGGQNYIRL